MELYFIIIFLVTVLFVLSLIGLVYKLGNKYISKKDRIALDKAIMKKDIYSMQIIIYKLLIMMDVEKLKLSLPNLEKDCINNEFEEGHKLLKDINYL